MQPKAARSRDAQSVAVRNISLIFCTRRTYVFYLGLGHGISNCPKLEDAQRRQMASMRSAQDGGAY